MYAACSLYSCTCTVNKGTAAAATTLALFDGSPFIAWYGHCVEAWSVDLQVNHAGGTGSCFDLLEDTDADDSVAACLTIKVEEEQATRRRGVGECWRRWLFPRSTLHEILRRLQQQSATMSTEAGQLLVYRHAFGSTPRHSPLPVRNI